MFISEMFRNDTNKTWSYNINGSQGDTIVLNPAIRPRTEGGLAHYNLVTVLWSPWNTSDTKEGSDGVKLYYSEHAPRLAHYNLVTVLWSPWNTSDTKEGSDGVKLYYSEHAPRLAPATVFTHMAVSRPHPPPQLSRNVMRKLAYEDINATSWKVVSNSLSKQHK